MQQNIHKGYGADIFYLLKKIMHRRGRGAKCKKIRKSRKQVEKLKKLNMRGIRGSLETVSLLHEPIVSVLTQYSILLHNKCKT